MKVTYLISFKNKKWFYCHFLFISLLSCTVHPSNQPAKYLAVEETENFKYPATHYNSAQVYKPQAYPYLDSCISFVDAKNSAIRIYSLSKQKEVDSIPLINEYYPKGGIENYKFISPDSILIVFSSTYMAQQHDSVARLVNRSNKLIDVFDYGGAPVNLKERKLPREKKYFSAHRFLPIYFDKKEQYMVASLAPHYLEYCDTLLFRNSKSIAGKIYLTNTGLNYEALNVEYPCHEPGVYYNMRTKWPRGGSDDKGNFLFSFGHSSLLIKINLRNNETEKVYRPFEKIDTILPSKYSAGDYLDREQPEYLGVSYDPYNNQWWRIARMGYDNSDSTAEIDKKFPPHLVMILDSNLEKVGEGILPAGITPTLVFLDEKSFVVKDHKSSFKENQLVLKSYTWRLQSSENLSISEVKDKKSGPTVKE